MRRVLDLPDAFSRYREIGGVLEFGVFEQAKGSDEEVITALASILETDDPHSWFRGEELLSLGSRSMSREALLGDWYDASSRQLVKVGTWQSKDGAIYDDPILTELEGVAIKSGGSPVPKLASGGQLAFAFLEPPYTLLAKPAEIQHIFDEILGVILPMDEPATVLDWSSADLPKVADFFEPGLEWWGVFLFSVFLPASGRLTVVAGSASD